MAAAATGWEMHTLEQQSGVGDFAAYCIAYLQCDEFILIVRSEKLTSARHCEFNLA